MINKIGFDIDSVVNYQSAYFRDLLKANWVKFLKATKNDEAESFGILNVFKLAKNLTSVSKILSRNEILFIYKTCLILQINDEEEILNDKKFNSFFIQKEYSNHLLCLLFAMVDKKMGKFLVKDDN